jgi:hypothetical protein
MANSTEWKLIRNPAFQIDIPKRDELESFVKQINYKDQIIIQNNHIIKGEVHGFNIDLVYIFNIKGELSVHKWNEVKFIKKPSSTEQTIEDLPNIIAIVFAIVIFIATFLMGYFYSYLPQLFPK